MLLLHNGLTDNCNKQQIIAPHCPRLSLHGQLLLHLTMTDRPLPILPLHRNDLPLDTVELARYMVGKYVVHDLPEGRISGRIVETEAYPLGDSTTHSFIGRRPHNGSMFLAPGHAYVRLTYGLSYMLNMSAEVEEVGAGILFRAIEPLEGLALMEA